MACATGSSGAGGGGTLTAGAGSTATMGGGEAADEADGGVWASATAGSSHASAKAAAGPRHLFSSIVIIYFFRIFLRSLLYAFTYMKGKDVTALWSVNDQHVRMPRRLSLWLAACFDRSGRYSRSRHSLVHCFSSPPRPMPPTPSAMRWPRLLPPPIPALSGWLSRLLSARRPRAAHPPTALR